MQVWVLNISVAPAIRVNVVERRCETKTYCYYCHYILSMLSFSSNEWIQWSEKNISPNQSLHHTQWEHF